MHHRFTSVLRLSLLVIMIAGLLFPQSSAFAAGTLTVTPLTWNIIGLDSNSPTTGPYRFPIGAQVCASGYTYPQTITSNFVFDDGADLYTGGTYINLRSGSLSSVSLTFNSNGCQDVYFEAEVKQLSGAYDTTRAYHITATDGALTASTPTPRELYVEHLISQSRNAITNVQLNGTSIPAGGAMTLMVGNTYTITLTGGTATQGYNQFESFINFPNTIFQVLSVSTTYSADDSPYVPAPNPQLYADACKWENNPTSPYYRSCIGGDYKAGGNTVVTTYVIKVISGGGTSQTLNTLLYDFSGSSYHYNADYSTGFRIANIVDPSNVTIAKSFSPNPTNVNGISALTITITNPNPGAISGYNFTDPLPGTMVVANPPGATTSSCGTPTFTAGAGANSISFTNGTIAANGSCTIKVNVTTSTTGSFTNTTNHLFVDSLDTTKIASSILTVNNAPAAGSGVCGLSLAKWTFPTGSSTTAPVVDTGATVTATASNGAGLTPILGATTSTADGTLSWGSNGAYDSTGALNTGSNDYFQFALNTTGYTSVSLSFMARRPNGNSPTQVLVYAGSTTTPPGTLNTTLGNPPTTEFPVGTNTWETSGTLNFTSATGLNTSGTTYFRIYGAFAKNNNPGSDLYVDDVTFTGCGTALAPTITKAFSPNPVAVNGTSTLTFTLSNTNSAQLTGAKFQDTLPAGVAVASPATFSTTCTGSPTWTPIAGSSQLDFGQTTGANIPGGSVATPGTCTVSVLVQTTTSGPHNNVSGFLSTTESGTTTTSVASATLTAVLPPVISKLFTTNPILASGTSTLAFTITNPNQNDALSGIAFTDTFPVSPGAMTVASPLTTTNSCSGTLQDNLGGALAAGDAGIRLTGGSLTAGSSCTVTVNVTAPTLGTYNNKNVTVSHVINAASVNGNTTTALLTVSAPHPAVTILKQVSTSASGPWYSFLPVSAGATVFYRFIVENAGDVALSDITVSDNVLGSICTIAGPLASYSSSTCTSSTTATGTGTHTNIATASVTYSGTPYSDTSTAAYGIATLALTKRADETYFLAAGNTLHYYYDVTTTSTYPLLGPVTITDDKTTATCPALSTVGNGDDYLNSGETLTCTATYNVTAGDVTAKLVTNNATAKIGAVTSNISSKTIPLAPDLTLTKTNNTSNTVGFGSTFDWTLTVNNSASAGAATFTTGQTILVDDLPSNGATYAVGAVNYGTTTGTIACSITTNTLTCTASGGNVTIPSGGSFSVPVTVTPTATGTLSNPRAAGTCKVDPGAGVITELDETNNNCTTNTVTVLDRPTITKSFSPTTITSGGTSTITFTLTNTNASALTNANFTDTLTNMSVASTTIGGTCAGVTNSPALTVGATALNLTIPSLPSGGCTVTVSVTSSTLGVNPNVTSGVTTSQTTVGNPSSSVDLTVLGKPTIAKAFSPTTIQSGGTSAITFTLTNPNATTLTNAAFTDTLTNMSVASTTIGGSCVGVTNSPALTVGATALNLTVPNLASGSCTVTVDVTSSTPGVNPNATSGVTTTQTTVGNPSTSVNLTVLGKPTIAKSFSPASITSGGSSTITFTLANPNATLLTGGSFTDTLNNMSISGAHTAGGSCIGAGTNSFTNGDTSLSFTGLTIPSSGSCTVTVVVTSTAVGVNPNITSGVTTTQTTVGNPSTSVNLTVVVPVATITVNPVSVAEDGATNLVYTVTLDQAPAVDTVINLTTTGTASGSDYTGSVATVTILAGTTSATVTIDPIADSLVEPDETVVITIDPGTGYTVGVPSSATGTITNDDIPVATITVNPTSVTEDGATNLVYTVTLDKAPIVDTVVNLVTTGTASASDYTGSVTSVTILAGTTSATVTIDPTADTVVEPDETVIITIDPGAGYTVGVPSSATGTITNEDLPVATITVNPASVAEDGATNLIYTVTLDQAPLVDTTVNLTTTGTASGSDYTGSVLSVTIFAGNTSATVTINPAVDTTIEPDETVILTIDPGTGYIVGIPSSATGTITNDDIPVATISVNPASVAEDDTTNLVYTVTLDQAPLVDTTINLSTTGTATTGDYTGSVVSVTILAGNTTATVTIDPTADTTLEPDETVIITIDPGSGYTVGVPASAIGTITNDDLPVATITVSPASVTEDGATNLVYTVTLDQAPLVDTIINLTTTGTATSGSDYTGAVATVTILAGNTTATVTIDPAVDAAVEPDETVVITIDPGTGYSVGVPSSATGTITNDDLPVATITVNPVSVDEDGATNLVYTVTLDQAPLVDTIINLATTGTASGSDYTGSVVSVTILAGNTTATVTIDPTVDTTVEPDETVIITIDPGTGYTVGVPSSATGTITNDDLPVATITVNPASVTEDGVTNLVYTVTLDQAPLVDTTINLSTTGTATSGSDYTGAVINVTILAGNTTGTVTIDPATDAALEPDETAIITIDPGTGYTVGVPASATGTITNDDLPVATITVNPASVSEDGATDLVYTVTLDQAPLVDTTINLVTTGTATSGGDYTGSVLSVTILAGNTTATVTINPTVDSTVEPDETVIITIDPGTGYSVGVPSSATGTITDDDLPVATISVSPASVAEDGATNLVYTVTLDQAPLVDTTINLTTTGTATSGDYTGSVISVTIFAGTTSATVTIDPTVDGVVEPDETVIITIDPGTGYTVGVPSSATGTITNDDVISTYTVSGQVRYDTDQDGNLADADSGLAGASVALFTDPNGDGDPSDGVQFGVSITTTSTGNYSFPNVIPGNYVVVETNPAGYFSTADSSAPNDDLIPVVLSNADSTGNIFLDSIDLPDAIDDSDTTNEGTPVTTSVLTNDDLGTTPTTITANTQGTNGSVSCTTTQCTYTPNAGFSGTDTYTYTITDNNGNTDIAMVTITVNKSLIGISKRVVSKTEVSPGTWDVTYEIRVENFGTVILNNVQVLDDLTTTFPSPTTFTVQSVSTSVALTKNPGYDGDTNVNLLTGGDTLAVGASGTITLVVRVIPASAGPFNNVAIASGQCPTCSTPVTDMSQDGSNPDPDGDKDPTNNNVSTPVDFGPNLFDPPFGLKVLDASGLPVLEWTMVWINNSNIVAINAQVSDPVVVGTTFVPGSLTCTPSGVTTTTSCTYDSVTNRILWSGNLGPDLGATDSATANNEITITFRVSVAAGVTSVRNVATVDSDLNGNLLVTDPGEQQVASASATWSAGAAPADIKLPATGFAPNVTTDLKNVPHETYLDTNGVTVEIPSLGLSIPIVGVPKKNGTWNVSWLGNQAGWLEGTAFPSWNGNSVLTGHVYNANGLPGPFVNLGKLKYGDQIIVHAYGQNYIFEVRTDEVVEPNDKSVFKHEEKPWLTLVTCKDYDEKTNTYKKRVVVRAVLVKVTTK